MSNDLMEDLRDFFNDANLSTYEVNAYIALLTTSRTNNLTAKEISSKSKVPSGRIYEVLEDLSSKGLVEIIESRPKKFKSVSINRALDNILKFQSYENKKKIDYLYDRAKLLESEIYNSEFIVSKEPTKLFWSTVFGTNSIMSTYVKFINESETELLFNDFVSKDTLKILKYGKIIGEAIIKAVDRGVEVKILWSFQYDDRSLTKENKNESSKEFKKIVERYKELYGLSNDLDNHEMKYYHKRMPSLYDILDKKRVILKLLNPLKPTQVFSCLNVQDPKLAKSLRNKFLRIWEFDAVGLDDL